MKNISSVPFVREKAQPLIADYQPLSVHYRQFSEKKTEIRKKIIIFLFFIRKF